MKLKQLAAVLVLLFTSTQAMAYDLCVQEEFVVVGFFNGVWNTPKDAKDAAFLLGTRYGQEYEGKKVYYEVFYNHTGSEADSNSLQDIAEVFVQRATELDAVFEDRYDLAWELLSAHEDNFWDKIEGVLQGTAIGVVTAIQDLRSSFKEKVVELTTEVFLSPPTQQDYEAHNTRIATIASHGGKMVMIAHSQGNLFVNQAYDYALTLDNMDPENIGVVHVAPASVVTNGPHILADLDFIINALRVQGIFTVPEFNVGIPLTHIENVDPSGHEFIKTYLRTSLDTSSAVDNAFWSEMNRTANPEQIASNGAFTATLRWNGTGDVDLHIFEPDSTHVYYKNFYGSVGHLDVDNTYRNGPEHYYASCNSEVVQEGIYTFGVNNYSNAEGRKATIQISTPTIADVQTKSITLGAEEGNSGNDNPEILIRLQVRKDENGEIGFSIP